MTFQVVLDSAAIAKGSQAKTYRCGDCGEWFPVALQLVLHVSEEHRGASDGRQ